MVNLNVFGADCVLYHYKPNYNLDLPSIFLKKASTPRPGSQSDTYKRPQSRG